jgi:hypothetical protein
MVTKGISQIIIIILLISCTPQKRLNRLVRNHPYLSKIDTIKIVDTIVVPNYEYDTIETVTYHDTTIIVNNEKIEARYYYDTLRKEIWHEITCKNDTIIKDRLIPYEKVTVQELTFWEKYGSMVIFGILILIGSKVLKKLGIL